MPVFPRISRTPRASFLLSSARSLPQGWTCGLQSAASGSSRHAADCAREFMERTLGMPVLVETPEAYVSHEGAHMVDAFNIAISQSGYSTNTLAALDSMET